MRGTSSIPVQELKVQKAIPSIECEKARLFPSEQDSKCWSSDSGFYGCQSWSMKFSLEFAWLLREGNLRILAYEFATMGSLNMIYYMKEGEYKGQQPGPTLDWTQRINVLQTNVFARKPVGPLHAAVDSRLSEDKSEKQCVDPKLKENILKRSSKGWLLLQHCVYSYEAEFRSKYEHVEGPFSHS
nr:PTI1-like tyrosine-protein kinase 3 isoform X2 [Ipomoea batatas]